VRVLDGETFTIPIPTAARARGPEALEAYIKRLLAHLGG
jgi:hypothetical protein